MHFVPSQPEALLRLANSASWLDLHRLEVVSETSWVEYDCFTSLTKNEYKILAKFLLNNQGIISNNTMAKGLKQKNGQIWVKYARLKIKPILMTFPAVLKALLL